jgi:ferredoxin-like protein FixX
MYYLRTRPATNAIKFTVDVEALIKESCDGLELKHFNSVTQKETSKITQPDSGEKENIDLNILQGQSQAPSDEKQLEKRLPLKACPLRRKKKNAEGELVEDEECLACGS